MAQQDKNFAKGLFTKKAWEDQNDPTNVIWSVGIAIDDFIDWLSSLPVNERGFVNLSMSLSRDGEKMNVWENDYKPQGNSNGRGNARGGAASGGRQQTQSRGGSNRSSGRSNAGSGATSRNSAGGATRGRTNTRAAQPQDQTDDLPF